MKNVKYHFLMIKRGIAIMLKMEKTFVLLHLIIEAITPFTPYLNIYMSARIIDELVESKNIDTLSMYVLLTIGLNITLSLVISGLNHMKNYRQNQFYINKNMYFSEKSMAMDYENMENREIHLLLGRIKMESQAGHNEYYLFTRAGDFIREIISIILASSLLISLFTNEDVLIVSKLLVLTLTVIVIYFNYYSTKKSNKLAQEMYGKYAPLNGFYNFYSNYCFGYNAGKDTRLYAMEHFVANESERFNTLSYNISSTTAKVSLKYGILNTISSDVLRISAYIFVAIACVTGGLSIGSMAKYVSCIVMVVGSFTGIINSMQTLMDNNKYLERYFSFLDIPLKMSHGTLPIEKHRYDEYEIEFCNVSFKYPGTEEFALKNVSFKIDVSKRMAIVGMNGSGKTTMIKLLCRLYDPTEGEIILNGTNIKDYNYSEYIKMFSVVFQDFKLFSFSLGQNVATSIVIDKDKVISCLYKAGFGERLITMPKNIDTPLYKDFEEDGIEISGGEAQKIALARALYKNAPFIVLDEPTAALDPIAEYETYTKFNEIIGDKTAIYISHRLSSCRFCDDIVVFHEGELIQRGSHETLLSDMNGKYYELWNAQAQHYNDRAI